MLLTRISRWIRSARDDDRGVALAAVLGLMVTAMLLTVLVSGAVVTASGYSTASRAGVQSEAAAEAGVAAARAGLLNGTCLANGNGSFASTAGSSPHYLATVWTPFGSGWTRGCPASLTTQVRILSTGYADATGVAGNTSGNTANLEVVLSAAVTPTQIFSSGPAVFAYNAGAFGNGGQLVSLDGSTPNVLVKQGSMTCDNNFQATANLVVNGGSLNVDNNCGITGNAWASGRVTFQNGGAVGGNVIGNGVTLGGSARPAAQRIWSSADLTVNGNTSVTGIVKAYSLSISGATLQGGGYIYGPTAVTNNNVAFNAIVRTQSITSTPNSWGSRSNLVVQNPITSPSFGSDLPAAPVVPNWVDFGSRPADFTPSTWTGFTVVAMTGTCDVAHVKTAIAQIGNAPGVIDGRGCSGGALTIDNSGQSANDVGMVNDLAIIAPSITIAGNARFATTASSRLWLINPDVTANQAPDCAAGEQMSITNNPSFSNVKVMIYTPCTASIVAGITVVGQIFAGSAALTNGSTLAYGPIGLPGYDLNYGSSTTQTGSEATRSVVSQRNVTAGN